MGLGGAANKKRHCYRQIHLLNFLNVRFSSHAIKSAYIIQSFQGAGRGCRSGDGQSGMGSDSISRSCFSLFNSCIRFAFQESSIPGASIAVTPGGVVYGFLTELLKRSLEFSVLLQPARITSPAHVPITSLSTIGFPFMSLP